MPNKKLNTLSDQIDMLIDKELERAKKLSAVGQFTNMDDIKAGIRRHAYLKIKSLIIELL